MKMNALLLALSAGCLAACSKGPQGSNNEAAIQLVKALPSDQQGLTYGQVFDAKSNCSPGGWSSSKDKFQRDVVAFRCTVNIPKEQLEGAESDARHMPDQQLGMIADGCHMDRAQLLRDQAADFKSRFDHFASVTEVIEYVVNQGEVVETHVGLLDATGNQIPLSAEAITFLPRRMQLVDNQTVEMSELFDIAKSGAPTKPLSCTELKQLGYRSTEDAALVEAPASQPSAQATGDEEPPPSEH